MPVDQLTNPAGLFQSGIAGPPIYGSGVLVETYLFNPAANYNLVNGMLVELMPLTAPSTGPVLVQRSATVGDGYVLGIVINAPTGGYTPGSIAEVVTRGVVLALFAANTVAGHFALQGTATAGTLIDSATATTGLTYAVVLSSVTIAAGTALVPVYYGRT